MYISGLPPPIQTTSVANQAAEQPTREAVAEMGREFEGILLATMLKETLKNAAKMGQGEEEGKGNNYMDMAFEQLAYYLGRQGILGIADQIVESSHQLEPKAANEQTSSR